MPSQSGHIKVVIRKNIDVGLCLDAERSDKSNTNLLGNELVSGSTVVSGRPSCGRSGPAVSRSRPDTRVDTLPHSPLLVGIVRDLIS